MLQADSIQKGLAMANEQAFWDNLFDKFDDQTKQDIAQSVQAIGDQTPEPGPTGPDVSREDQITAATASLEPGSISPATDVSPAELGDLPLVNTPGHTMDR